MEEKKQKMSFQFSKDGTRSDLRDKHQPKQKVKKPETEWVFPEPDHVIEKQPPVVPSKIDEKREIFHWDESSIEQPTKKKTAPIKQPFTSVVQKGKALPWTLVAAVTSAILIGISLGYITLTITNGGMSQPATNEAIEVSTTPVIPVSEWTEVQASSNELYVIQGGAFSTNAASQQVADSFKKDGYPVTIESGGDTELLYIAAAGSKDQAIQLVELYQEAGFDSFVKRYEVSAPADEESDVVKWFDQAGVHLSEVAEAAAKKLGETPLGEDEIGTLTQQLTQLENQREPMMESATDEVKASAQTVMAKLAESSQLLQGEAEDVWGAQQLLLEAMPVYKKSLDDLSKNE